MATMTCFGFWNCLQQLHLVRDNGLAEANRSPRRGRKRVEWWIEKYSPKKLSRFYKPPENKTFVWFRTQLTDNLLEYFEDKENNVMFRDRTVSATVIINSRRVPTNHWGSPHSSGRKPFLQLFWLGGSMVKKIPWGSQQELPKLRGKEENSTEIK